MRTSTPSLRTTVLRPGDIITKPNGTSGTVGTNGANGPSESPTPITPAAPPSPMMLDVQLLQAMRAFIQQISPQHAVPSLEQLRDRLLPLLTEELSSKVLKQSEEELNKQLRVSQEGVTKRLAENKSSMEEMIKSATAELNKRAERIAQQSEAAATDFNAAVTEWQERVNSFPDEAFKAELMAQLEQTARDTAKLTVGQQHKELVSEVRTDVLSTLEARSDSKISELFSKAVGPFRKELQDSLTSMTSKFTDQLRKQQEEFQAKVRADLDNLMDELGKLESRVDAGLLGQVPSTAVSAEPEEPGVNNGSKFKVTICSQRVYKRASDLERRCPKNIRLNIEDMDRMPRGACKRAHYIIITPNCPRPWRDAFEASEDKNRVVCLDSDSIDGIVEQLEVIGAKTFFEL